MALSSSTGLSHLPLLGGDDEPKTPSYQITLLGPIGADVRQQKGTPRPAREVATIEVLNDYSAFLQDESSAERLKNARKHLDPFWSQGYVSDFNAESIKLYCKQQQRAPGTLKRELGILKAAVNHAISMERLIRFELPDIPIEDNVRDKVLSRSELAKLLNCVRHVPRLSGVSI